LDKANARASFGIFLGYRLAPGCRWNGEYLVADVTDFINLDLLEAASGHGIVIHEHITKVVRLPKEGYVFPLKQRYDFINTTVDGLRHVHVEPGDLPEIVVGVDEQAASEDPLAVSRGASSTDTGEVPPAAAPHDDHGGGVRDFLESDDPVVLPPVDDVADAPDEKWAFDRRGRRYRVDDYGIRIVPGSTRPEGFLPADWKKLSKKERQEAIDALKAGREKLGISSEVPLALGHQVAFLPLRMPYPGFLP
jgi:hypothetical protein